MFEDPFRPKKRKRTLTSADKKRIAAKQQWKCKKCKRLLPVRYHVDHIKEFSVGGSDRDSNLQALCPDCHAEKTEADRHRKKQVKIREKEREKSSGILGDMNIFGEPSRKRGRKKKSDNPFDFGF